MTLDVAFLESFRDRFAQKEPHPRHLVRRVTKFDLYLSVRDLVDRHRAKGYGWDGIAELFQELGVPISASTLKTCARRARAKNHRGSSVRSTSPRPARSSAAPLAVVDSLSQPAAAPPPTVLQPDPPVLQVQSTIDPDDTAGSRKEDPISSPAAALPTVGGAMAAAGAKREASRGPPSALPKTEISADASTDGDSGSRESLTEHPSAARVVALRPSSPAREEEAGAHRLVAAARARPPRRMAFQPQRDEDDL